MRRFFFGQSQDDKAALKDTELGRIDAAIACSNMRQVLSQRRARSQALKAAFRITMELCCCDMRRALVHFWPPEQEPEPLQIRRMLQAF